MRTAAFTVAALASLALAQPTKRDSSKKVVGYWGSGSGQDLGVYCAADAGYDIVVLSFISNFGNGAAPSGGFSEPSDDGYCTIGDGTSGSCPSLANDIKTCQANGKTVILSLGGGGAPANLASQADAEGVAYSLWNAFGNPQFKDEGDATNRPFGDVFVNGFDLDIELDTNRQNWRYLVAKLREYVARDSGNQYFITAAPQCYFDEHGSEPNLGDAIENSQFDKLFIQFYNNWQACDASNYYGAKAEGAEFNYDRWVSYVSNTPSSGAELYVGIPASKTAATSQSWIDPSDLPKLNDYLEGKDKFAGFMFWEAVESDKYSGNGCTFAQELRSILTTGKTC